MLGGISLQLFTGYTVAFLVYQAGTLISSGTLGVAFIPGIIGVAVMVGIITTLIIKADKKVAEEKAAKVAL